MLRLSLLGPGRLHPKHTIGIDQLVEALVRCGEAKFELFATMNEAQRGESGLLQLLGMVEDVVSSAMLAKVADRFDFVSAPPLGHESDSERAAWLSTWPRIDLSSLPGFPQWDEAVHGLLQRNFADMVSIFCYYAKLGGADAGGAGWRSLDEGEWDGLLTDLLSTVPSRTELQQLGIFAFGVACGRALPKEASIPKYLQALVVFAYLRANPSQRHLFATGAPDKSAPGARPKGGRLQRLVSVPEALSYLLSELLLPNCHRDVSLDQRAAYHADQGLHAALPPLRNILEGFFTTAAGGTESKVSLSKFFSLFTADRQLLRTVKIRNHAVGVIPAPDGDKKMFCVALNRELIHTCFLDSQPLWQGLIDDAKSKPTNEVKAVTLDYEQFVEALVRCADAMWVEVHLMSRAQRLDALVHIMRRETTEEKVLSEAIDAHACAVRVPTPAEDQLPNESDVDFMYWTRVWKRVELRFLRGYDGWEREVHDLLHANFLQIGSVFVRYSGQGSEAVAREAALAVKPREKSKANVLARSQTSPSSAAIKLAGWLDILRDAGLMRGGKEAVKAMSDLFFAVIARETPDEDVHEIMRTLEGVITNWLHAKTAQSMFGIVDLHSIFKAWAAVAREGAGGGHQQADEGPIGTEITDERLASAPALAPLAELERAANGNGGNQAASTADVNGSGKVGRGGAAGAKVTVGRGGAGKGAARARGGAGRGGRAGKGAGSGSSGSGNPGASVSAAAPSLPKAHKGKDVEPVVLGGKGKFSTDVTMPLHLFLQLLCRHAFKRVEAVGPHAFPAELRSLLRTLLDREDGGVMRDACVQWRHDMVKDSALQDVLRLHQKTLRELYQPSRQQAGRPKISGSSWRFTDYWGFLDERGLLADVSMQQTSEIVGDSASTAKSELRLSTEGLVRAWLAMRVNPLPPGVRQPPPRPPPGTKMRSEVGISGLRYDEDGGETRDSTVTPLGSRVEVASRSA